MDKLTDEQKQELEALAAKTIKELDECDEDERQRILNHCQARGVELFSERPPSSPAESGNLHKPSLITQVEAKKIQAVREALWDRAQEWFKKDEKCIQYFNKKPEAMRQMR
jgi:TRAP-type C4-dicarboxylate transport system substrate-binding protein